MTTANLRTALVCGVLAVSNVLIGPVTQAQDVSFLAPRNYDVTRPSTIAVGDFNGDGVPDLVVGKYSSTTLSVLLGSGDGSFEAARNFPGAPPTSIVVGDFNGDGVQDLAVANYGGSPRYPGSVSVYLGNGDGSFQTARNFRAGIFHSSIAMGDFNGDGWQDLVVADYFSNDIWVLLGNGDGSFQTARNFEGCSNPVSVIVADFNGDGVPDLAVGASFATTVSVLLGNGDGTFQIARLLDGVELGGLSLAVGDFNGDGMQDLAVASYHSNSVSVFLGNGDGSFQPAENFRPADDGSFPNSIAVGDFNHDGVQDLVVSYLQMQPGGNVSVLLGNGDGSFQAPRIFAVGIYGSESVTVGDFNGDGLPDLAVGTGPSNLSVLINNTPIP